jgi:hypothetical protein
MGLGYSSCVEEHPAMTPEQKGFSFVYELCENSNETNC